MTRFAEMMVAIIPGSSVDDVATVLNITPLMWERICKDDKYVKPWLMRYVINRYKGNPLYVYGGSEDMLLIRE